MRICFALGCVVAIACAKPHDGRPFTGTLPPKTHLDMAGTFTLTAGGELVLALARPCTEDMVIDHGPWRSQSAVKCDDVRLRTIHVVAHTPWNRDLPGTWTDASHVRFSIDWADSGLDPLADDAVSVVGRPWLISGTRWQPTADDSERILRRVGEATETETELVRGGRAPNLEVMTFEIEGGTLRPGSMNTLVVRIRNRGQGTAYRVVATVRSSVEVLRGQRLSFGAIKPGADKVRTRKVMIPDSETAPDTMLVLALAEGNGIAPPDHSHRVAIARATAGPELGVRCAIAGQGTARPDFEAGQRKKLRCTVDNTGKAAAIAAALEVAVAGGATVRSPPQAIAVGYTASFEMEFAVPGDLAIDALVQVSITARDGGSSRVAHTTVTGVVRKAKLCTAGQLTQAQYRTKTNELRAAVAAGDITQAQFDRFDAELVSCLK